jgi:cytochrome c oxidase assembly protein subunit 15
LAALVLIQFLTGLSNVVLGWPMVAAVLHTGGAAAMVVVLVLAWQRTRPQPLTPTSA